MGWESSESIVPSELRGVAAVRGIGLWGKRGDVAARRSFDLARGRIAEYAVVAVFVACLAIYEWVRWLFGQPPQPGLMTIFSGLMLAYMGLRVWMVWPRLTAYRSEIGAHRVLRQSLEELGDRGYFMFEPPTGSDGLVRTGTVVVGPNGVFALTVRNFTRSEERDEEVDFGDAETLMVGGHEALANPVGQAQRVAGQVVKAVKSRLGEAPWVVPVLVCPGWRMGARSLERGDSLVVTNETLVADAIRGIDGELATGELIAVCEVLDSLLARQEGIGMGRDGRPRAN